MAKGILLVDDSPVIRDLLREYLETELSLPVCGEASDGLEAVEKAAEVAPELIIMDFSMPRMNDLEAAREIKRRQPEVPIILFTQHKEALQESDIRSAGINAIVSKTEKTELLVDKIFRLLGPSRERLGA